MKPLPNGLKVSSETRKMRCWKMIITCCSTISSPAQANRRPVVLAKVSSPITTPQRNLRQIRPMTKITRKTSSTAKKNSVDPP